MKVLSAPIIAIIVIIVAFAGITVYSGIFPPASVVESGSMQHSNNWQFGVINTGDIVLVKKIDNPQKNIVTYVEGRQTGFSTYGDYGNVILYNAPHNLVVIHRAMFYLSWNNGEPVVAGANNQSWITVNQSYVLIKDVGYEHRNLVVYLGGYTNESGFITMGDHNLATAPTSSYYYNSTLNAYKAADENVGIIGHPVTPSDIVGEAQGQIPWFGLIKLNIMRIQGKWQYPNDVPNYSYDYLVAAIFTIMVLILFPYSDFIKKSQRKNNKK